MRRAVDPALLAWTKTNGGKEFCAKAREKLVRGRKLDKWLEYTVSEKNLEDLQALFGHDESVVKATGVHLRKADLALRRTRFGVGLHQLLIAVDGPVISARARKRYDDRVNLVRVVRQRVDLRQVMVRVPQLDRERRLLEALEPGPTAQVPPGSATETKSWPTYEAAIRAAAYWYPESLTRVPWEKEVASNALSGSKRWTMAQLEAFSRLVGMGLKEALQWTDALIRVAGPLSWTNQTPIAHAGLATPWIDIPAHGSLESGELHCPADGVLLVENQTTFEHLRRNTDLTKTWLCVWLEGNISKGLIPFLRHINPRHLAAWCDLDPDGIEIVQSVGNGLGREVLPVGMTPEIWANGAKLAEKKPGDHLAWQQAATALAEHGPELLRPLAAAIATNGHRCEQETIQFETTPEVVRQLKQLVTSSGDVPVNPLTQLSLPQLRERTSLKWRTHQADVLPLWVAEMDVLPAPSVAAAVHEAITRGDTGYPAGTTYAEAVCDFAADRWGWHGIAVERTAVVPDVMAGIVEILRLLTEPGDIVVVCAPTYAPFYAFVTHAGRNIVAAPLGPDGRIDIAALDEAFARAQVFLMSNPHNPTGAVHTQAELEDIAALAQRHNVQVISDEIHAPLMLGDARFTPYLSVDDNAFALLSASKAWNLAGLKAALAVAGSGTAANLALLPEEVSHGPSHLGVLAHTAAFRDGGEWLDQLLAGLTANRALLEQLLAQHLPDVGYIRPEGTYLAWLDCTPLRLDTDPVLDGPSVVSDVTGPARHFLDHARVALSSGHIFGSGGAGHVRINFATHPDILTEAIIRMAESLNRLGT